jgi:hypothetical protein
VAKPKNSFEVMPEIAWRMPRISTRFLWWWRVVYRLLAVWRHWRIQHTVTRWLGPQYRRSRDLIEIDITYLCNLHCLNCNRSVHQAREASHMPLEMVSRFVDESVARGKVWRRIRVLGGEPTLHPQFPQIIETLTTYSRRHPDCIVEVVTNGHGPRVAEALASLPEDVWVDNSAKTGRVQPTFGPFNLAPRDDPKYRGADFSNACAVARDCGVGLTPMGYYPCAVAGGIDRILRANLGVPDLPQDADDMLAAAERLCSYCGRFRDGHFVPRPLRPELTTEAISPSWEQLYADWHAGRRAERSRVDKAVDPSAASDRKEPA